MSRGAVRADGDRRADGCLGEVVKCGENRCAAIRWARRGGVKQSQRRGWLQVGHTSGLGTGSGAGSIRSRMIS